MDKPAREIMKMAERLGVEKPSIQRGDPHCRLVGTYRGQPFKVVVTLSKGKFARDRGPMTMKTNIRRKMREIEATVRRIK